MDIDLYPINMIFYNIDFNRGMYNMKDLDFQNGSKIRLKMRRLYYAIQTFRLKEAGLFFNWFSICLKVNGL